MPKILKFRVVIHQDEDGFLWQRTLNARVPYSRERLLGGCKKIKEVIKVCLDEAKYNKPYRDSIGWPKGKPDSRFFGVIDVSVQKPSFV